MVRPRPPHGAPTARSTPARRARRWAALAPAALWLVCGGACNLVSGLDAIQIEGCVEDADCDRDHFCVIATHQCALRLTPGSGPCGADDACASDVCGQNGVCCAARCTAPGDPCGAAGCAGGDGACVYPPATTVCGTTCAGGTLVTTSCDGAGRCDSVRMSVCPDNLACLSPTACATSCGTSGGVCLGGYYCQGTCQALKPSGTICASAGECVSQVCNCDACGSCVCM